MRSVRGRMADGDFLALAQVHVHTAGQARVEATYGPHDIDALESVGTVLLEDRRILHGILVWSRRAERIAWARVPWRRRIRVIVGDLTVPNDEMVRQHAPDGLVEPTANGLVGHRERRLGDRASRVNLVLGAFQECECRRRSIGL